ncbi:MAG: phosphatidylserine/phosphatidylglycerophosphate/cardiolipin synthase family protein [Clostridiales bacterium]|nr:phosphatidylserine/phosphatidylglycerophosphate/cardiolipin synthase family protein [Clostridiales bacterium]
MGKEMTFELLEGGRNAFPEIIRQIRAADHEITVHMFIWREDRIGTEIAREIIASADRGVKVTIEKDMYAVILEYAEESQRSLCHRPDLRDRFQISMLELLYNRELAAKRLRTSRSSLYTQLKEHPNIVLKDDVRTCDHSKYYIFDRKVMILGGINIEDKEYYSDSKGRVYHDYMIKISDADIVVQFLEKRADPQKESDLFMVNMKEPVSCFELKSNYMELIDGAERELCIMMAYFAPEKDIMSAIKRALHRGVHVRILIPRSANYMDDMNRSAVSKLHKYSKAHSGDYSGRLGTFMTDRMLHAKLLMSERRVIIGSCNINRKAFTKLDELAVSVDNDDSPFAAEIRSSVEEAFQNAECVSTRGKIKYNPVLAAIETAVM